MQWPFNAGAARPISGRDIYSDSFCDMDLYW